MTCPARPYLNLKEVLNLAAPQGFEPRYAAPEAAVLPLNEGAASKTGGLAAVSAKGQREPDRSANLFMIRAIPASVKHRIEEPGCSLLVSKYFQRTQSKDAIACQPARSSGQKRCAHERDRRRAPLNNEFGFQPMQQDAG